MSSSDPWNRRNFVAAVAIGIITVGVALFPILKDYVKPGPAPSGDPTGPTTPPATTKSTRGTSTTKHTTTPPKETEEPPDVLARSDEVPVGGGLFLGSREMVLTQPSEGVFRAFSSVCTHQGCDVSSVADGVIQCPCHGSQFDAYDGNVVSGPAQKSLKRRSIDVTSAGDITLG